jgi:hypothetical protein
VFNLLKFNIQNSSFLNSSIHPFLNFLPVIAIPAFSAGEAIRHKITRHCDPAFSAGEAIHSPIHRFINFPYICHANETDK